MELSNRCGFYLGLVLTVDLLVGCGQSGSVPPAEEAASPKQVETFPAKTVKEPAAKTQPPTCAFLDFDRIPQAAILESRLMEKTQTVWVERNQIDRVMREQELQALLSPEGGTGRVQIGKLLKADVLVMLRSGASQQAKAMDLVVSETRHGLRLCVESVPVSNDTDGDVSALMVLVKKALERYHEKIVDICAVPPFVSNDLGYQYDFLKAAYAKLIEQRILERKGMLVVELAEAKEVGREVVLAGGGALERRAPLYFLGEYRHDRQSKEHRQTICLRLLRGEKQLGLTEKTNLQPGAAVAFVRQASVDLLANAGTIQLPPTEPAIEAKQLADRAATFQKLGNWEESLALIEASLLLKPDQDELHRLGVVALGHLTRRYLGAGGSAQTLDQVQRGAAYYFRGLEHLEIFLQKAGKLSGYRVTGQTDFISDFFHSTNSWVIPGRPGAEMLEALAAANQREREIQLRLVTLRARAGWGDEVRFMSKALTNLSERDKFALLLRMLKELQDLPGAGRRASQFATHGYSVHILDSPEGQEFLDQLARLPNKEIQQQAKFLQRSLETYRAAKQQKQPPIVPKPPSSAGPPQILFRPVVLSRDGAQEDNTPVLPTTVKIGCLPAGKGLDVIWAYGFIGIMKEKGKFTLVRTMPRLNLRIGEVCFDGRYIWAPVHPHLQVPSLLVIEPKSEEVWEITAEDGLPLAAVKDLSNKYTQQFLTVAPLAPGKICLAGSFGRTWLALVTFDPKMGPRIKVFHEAREHFNQEDKQQWQRTTVAFTPTYMFTLTARPDQQGKSAQRVLLGRSSRNVDVMNHPLLIDPETMTVEVVRDGAAWAELPQRNMAVHDGALYWLRPSRRRSGDPPSPNLWRLGFPDFAKKMVGQKVHACPESAFLGDKVVFYAGRVHVVSREWLVADAPDKPFIALRGDIPERLDPRWFLAGPVHLNDNETERIQSINLSNHYGLLAFTERNKGGSVYQIEFSNLPEATKP